MTTDIQQDSSELVAKLADGSLDGTWRLEPSQSSASIKTKSVWGLVKINGVFTELRGEATVAQGVVTATVTIGSGSIDTKNAKRDKHLKSADLLDSESYPDITFVLDTITSGARGTTATGSLTVQEVSKPVAIDVTSAVVSDSTIKVAGSLEVDRGEFGVSWNQLGMAGMVNTVTLGATFVRS